MIKVGLTGGIGSGKSYIARIFTALDIPVFNADHVAREAYFDPKIAPDIIKLLGNETFIDGKLNSKWIAATLFRNQNLLDKLSDIIHPWVEQKYRSWADNMSAASYSIKEAAILFESGSYKKLDLTICVTAPDEIRIKRVMQRDHVGPDEVLSRMKHQWLQGDKARLANFVVNNDGTNLVLPQVLHIHHKLLEK